MNEFNFHSWLEAHVVIEKLALWYTNTLYFLFLKQPSFL